jgi:hypothetical protein
VGKAALLKEGIRLPIAFEQQFIDTLSKSKISADLLDLRTTTTPNWLLQRKENGKSYLSGRQYWW